MKYLTKSAYLLALMLPVITLSACSYLGLGKDDEQIKADVLNSPPADEMYDGAYALAEQGRLKPAIAQFQEVERLYPFSPYALKAKVAEAMAHYYDEEYDSAIAVVDEFVGLNPGNADVPFMYYLKAICFYDRIQDVKRDQDITIRAQKAFEEVMNRFPKSRYARDSEMKLDLIKDHLAAKEMEVGRFYLKKKNYPAAMNRFKEVVRSYDDTAQVEESLYRLTETNVILGFVDEARRYATLLGYNYPSSAWYKRAYKLMGGKETAGETTFVGKMLDSVGLGAEPRYSQPASFDSSPNLVDTGGWISDDSAIGEDLGAAGDANPEAEAAPEATPEAESGAEQ